MSSFGYDRVQSPAARRLKNLRIDEVSSVDRGAGRGVSVVLMKRDAPLTDTRGATAQRLIAFAKSDRCSKAELSALLHKLAASQREDGETIEQSFVKCITCDPLGKELFAIMQRAPVSARDHFAESAFQKFRHAPGEPEVEDAADDDGSNPYHAALRAMAEKHVAQGNSTTVEQAYDHIARHSPLGRKLMQAATQHDLERAARSQS